ncbi:HAD-like protein [Terfezia boudieri ATCC MYA-4762]|uniref:HAD-like protein n=1 Tax=Terfezia boudieri ATCC MYA-4762 TaxID=1051890 RepID=A0A3N4MFZ6_9PEZI|nr:HAD-like protein [Terfezia boudieri ATCC MYA-4762]
MSTIHPTSDPPAQSPINPTVPDNIPLSELPPRTRRRFAPLNPDIPNDINAPRLKGVVFDVDGTLCQPQTWMFSQMRSALDIPKSVDILNHIYSLPLTESLLAMEAIKSIERTAMHQMVPQAGLVPLMTYLDSRSILKGICTRNFDGPVTHLRENYMPGILFHPVITRTFRPPKPDPAGILFICGEWDVKGSEVIMVGDSMDDMAAGRRAGAATVLLRNEVNGELVGHEFTDCVVGGLEELVGILERGFEEVDRSGGERQELAEEAIDGIEG